MKKVNAVLLVLITTTVILLTSTATPAQHKHEQSGQKKSGMTDMKSQMASMMQSPHHQLMMAYMRTMTEFAKTLRDQAVKPAPLDGEFARAIVAELRHNLDATETLHQKHIAMMSAEMRSKMQAMMEKMDKDRTMVKDHVTALETVVKADHPDSKQVAAHANALLKQLGMMASMSGHKSPKEKTTMKM